MSLQLKALFVYMCNSFSPVETNDVSVGCLAQHGSTISMQPWYVGHLWRVCLGYQMQNFCWLNERLTLLEAATAKNILCGLNESKQQVLDGGNTCVWQNRRVGAELKASMLLNSPWLPFFSWTTIFLLTIIWSEILEHVPHGMGFTVMFQKIRGLNDLGMASPD